MLRADYSDRLLEAATTAQLAAINTQLTQQAMMIAYLDDFKLMMAIAIAMMPLLLVLRRSEKGTPATEASFE